jgi:hypothetical protein
VVNVLLAVKIGVGVMVLDTVQYVVLFPVVVVKVTISTITVSAPA